MPFQTGLTERAPREWLRSGSSRFNSERADILRKKQTYHATKEKAKRTKISYRSHPHGEQEIEPYSTRRTKKGKNIQQKEKKGTKKQHLFSSPQEEIEPYSPPELGSRRPRRDGAQHAGRL